ncbi:MAG: hypothetical protein HUU50_15025 [Candidatus Brocadiae bacterium]|nr:hypothetical protein [Candidatus Brocadiia bacterium]
MHGGPFIKKSLSKLAGCSIYWLSSLPTHDITNSYKLYKKSYLDEITLESTGGFEIGMEITAKAHKKQKKIVEIPSQWWDRTQGKSNFKLLKWLPKYLKWYLYVLSPCCLIKQR